MTRVLILWSSYLKSTLALCGTKYTCVCLVLQLLSKQLYKSIHDLRTYISKLCLGSKILPYSFYTCLVINYAHTNHQFKSMT